MTLRRLCLLFTVLSLLSTVPALADGKADWRDYAWQTIPLTECWEGGRTLTSLPCQQKWHMSLDESHTRDLPASPGRRPTASPFWRS